MTLRRGEDSNTTKLHEGDELLTLDEVAEFLRTPSATLRYWRHCGVGPHSFKIGRSVRYWRSTVIAWIQDQEHHDVA